MPVNNQIEMDDDSFEFLGVDGNMVKLSSICKIEQYKSYLQYGPNESTVDSTSTSTSTSTLDPSTMLEILSMNQILDTLLYVDDDN